MKKILLSLMLFAAVSKAQTVNLDLTYTASPIGQASQVAAQVYGIDTTLTYTAQTSRQIGAIGDALKVTLAGGSVTVTGGTFVLTSNTAVAQGAAGTQAWFVQDSATAALLHADLLSISATALANYNQNLVNYGYTTTTAAGTAGRGGTTNNYTLTGTVMVNVTTLAAVNAPSVVTIQTGQGPNPGFLWRSFPCASTWVPPISYVAATSTPLVMTLGIGTCVGLSATAAAVTQTVGIDVAPIY